MADRYAVGTGNWNDTSTWSASSGGSTGESVPVDGDDVYFDANSGTVTLNAAARCDRITFNGGGTLDTDSSNDYAFTVDERMYLQSGGTFNANGSTIKIGDSVVGSEYTLQATNGTFNGGDGIHTIGSIKVNGGTLNLSAGTTTINGAESSSSAGCLQKTSAGTLAHNNGTVIFDVQNYSGSIILLYGGDITLYKVYLDATASNQRLKLWGAGATSPRRKLTVAHNLTIRGGTFRTQHSSVEEVDLDVGGDLLLEPSASAGTDVKAQFESYGAVVNVSGKLETRGTWNSGGNNYTPKSIYNGGTGTHSYQGINFLVGTDVTLSSGVTSITGAIGGTGAGTAFRSDVQNGYNTYSNGSGTVKFTSSNDQHLYSTGQQADNFTQFHNLTLEKTSSTLQGLTSVGFHIKVGNDLTITSGILNTNTTDATNHDLTVTGTTTIGPASGAADQATLTCNSSDISLGALRQQADYAVNIEIGGTFTGGTGTHTFGSLYMAQSANAKATMTTGQLKVNGYNNSANKAWRVEYGGDTFDNANGTVKFQFNGFDSRMSMRGESHANNAFHNLIIHMNGDTRQISPDNGNKIIVDNDLTITRGILAMGQNHALEVGGDVEIDDGSDTAVLEMGISSNISSQAATFGSLTIGNTGTYKATSGTTTITDRKSGEFSLSNAGTFTNNDGTVLFNAAVDQHVSFTGSGNMHHCTVNKSDNDLVQRSNLTIEGDLNITTASNHDFRGNTGTHTLDVTGDVTLSAGRFGGNTTYTANHSYGSLTIASGAEWRATSGTTNITYKNSSNYMFDNNGTFTHNNGTVNWKADTSSGTWYAMDGGSSATQTEFYNISTERVRASGTEQYRFWVGGAGKHLTVLNNIDIGENTNVFSSNGSGNFKLLGNCYIRGTTGGLNLDNVTTVNMGTVTIESGGTLEFADGNSINVEGIRNIGGTVQAT